MYGIKTVKMDMPAPSPRHLIMYPEEWAEGKPLVSVIAICHNHAPYVLETLESIRNQTYPNIELIIINNLKDGCEEIIRQWITTTGVNCIFIQNETPRNVSQNMNLGLTHVHGEYFQGFSCDDVMELYKIEYQIKKFQRISSKYAIVYGNSFEIDSNSRIVKKVKRGIYRKVIRATHKSIIANFYVLNTPTVLIKTSAAMAIGGYCNMLSAEDYYFFSRISESYKIKHYNKFLVKRRVHGRNLSSSINLLSERLKALDYLSSSTYHEIAKKTLKLRLELSNAAKESFLKRLLILYKYRAIASEPFYWLQTLKVLTLR